jgi:hypothetical protein
MDGNETQLVEIGGNYLLRIVIKNDTISKDCFISTVALKRIIEQEEQRIVTLHRSEMQSDKEHNIIKLTIHKQSQIFENKDTPIRVSAVHGDGTENALWVEERGFIDALTTYCNGFIDPLSKEYQSL